MSEEKVTNEQKVKVTFHFPDGNSFTEEIEEYSQEELNKKIIEARIKIAKIQKVNFGVIREELAKTNDISLDHPKMAGLVHKELVRLIPDTELPPIKSKWEEREIEVFKNGYKKKQKKITQKYPPGSLQRTEVMEV